ncbi:MAG: Na(+)/H(+) antiporter subunit B [ANME-2 cluster archaeon]|nr:Na(+)/H(+) antiporter subunit B [ANME-2 cluster archaeon]MDF1558066.1 Na(+)/H(+) antiporter subunit B [ANME-2 cluster archaeon]
MKEEDVIIRTVIRLIVPFIQIFGLYVIFHGGSGPGGGFQGGVILAASMILYVMAFGVHEGRRRLTEKTNMIMRSTGLFIYSGIGLLAVIFGGKYLDYGAVPLPFIDHPSEIRAILIDGGVEVGVGITVMAVMVTIFFELYPGGTPDD